MNILRKIRNWTQKRQLLNVARRVEIAAIYCDTVGEIMEAGRLYCLADRIRARAYREGGPECL